MDKKDLIIIPFHDWRKSEKEGFRTRDVHIIKALERNSQIRKILIVNRPCTLPELVYKNFRRDLPGEIILSVGNFKLTQVSPKTYVADFESVDFLGQILKRYRWFLEKYSDQSYFEFINRCMATLKLNQPALLIQNLFAFNLALKIETAYRLFDAWDNFLRFPSYKNLQTEVHEAYTQLSRHVTHWATNSEENKEIFQKEFKTDKITVIKNGLKSDFLSSDPEIPEDMKGIPRPIAGFGGKISYLLNTELINYIVEDNPEVSFVFVGQILDKKIYRAIDKASNVYFLGDKHYSKYPSYVHNFDICLVPYNIKEGQHGGDSIKVYEYLLTGKKVVGTCGNGLQDLTDYVYVVDTPSEFSHELRDLYNAKKPIDPDKYSWETKSNQFLDILLNG